MNIVRLRPKEGLLLLGQKYKTWVEFDLRTNNF